MDGESCYVNGQESCVSWDVSVDLVRLPFSVVLPASAQRRHGVRGQDPGTVNEDQVSFHRLL